jgi:hypothetical protein
MQTQETVKPTKIFGYGDESGAFWGDSPEIRKLAGFVPGFWDGEKFHATGDVRTLDDVEVDFKPRESAKVDFDEIPTALIDHESLAAAKDIFAGVRADGEDREEAEYLKKKQADGFVVDSWLKDGEEPPIKDFSDEGASIFDGVTDDVMPIADPTDDATPIAEPVVETKRPTLTISKKA